MRRFVAVFSSYPLTSAVLASVLLVALFSGTLLHPLRADLLGRWGFALADFPAQSYRLLTSPFFVLRPFMLPSVALIILMGLGGCERRLGSRWAAVAFGTGHVVGAVLAPVTAWLLARAGIDSFAALVTQRDVGASDGAFGAAGALIATLPGAAGTVFFLGMLVFLFVAVSVEFEIWSIGHILAFAAGIGVGGIFIPSLGRPWPQLHVGTTIERRHRPSALAALVWIVGLVNVMSSFSPTHLRRLGWFEQWLPFDSPHWPRHALFVVGILLMILSRGLARGQRRAWWLAFLLLSTVTMVNAHIETLHPRTLVSFGTMVLFLVWQSAFRARFNFDLSLTRAIAMASTSLSTFLLAGFLGLRHGFEPHANWSRSLHELYVQLTFGSNPVLVPTTEPAGWFLEILPFATFGSLAIVLAALLRSAGPRPPTAADRELAQRILSENNASGTSYMTLWGGNSIFLAAGQRAYVSYRVANHVAVALGSPVGSPNTIPTVSKAFATFCSQQGWGHVFYAVTAATASWFSNAGYALLQIGEEAILSLPGMSFKGKDWQRMRSAFNRAQRSGVSFAMYEGGTIPRNVRAQLGEIYDEVAASRALPPMEFTLGKPADVDDPNVNVGVAVDATGRVHGYVDWLPIDARHGWVIDLMMRRTDAMTDVMEFLIGSSILAFQDRGYGLVSLGVAPLADLDRDPTRGSLVQRAIATIYDKFDHYYRFRSLFEYKARFQPKWEPVYLAYEGAEQLPGIALAVVGAHLPNLDPLLVGRLLGSTLKSKVSEALGHRDEGSRGPDAD